MSAAISFRIEEITTSDYALLVMTPSFSPSLRANEMSAAISLRGEEITTPLPPYVNCKKRKPVLQKPGRFFHFC